MGNGMFLPLFLLTILPLTGHTEGTKQITPFPAAAGQLCIDKSRNDFGFFNSAPEFRINIFIASVTEKICFGLGITTFPVPPVTVQYRIKDPGGNIVFGPDVVPNSGQGFIATYDQAVAGPFMSAGGYNPFVCTPSDTGNYYLEFSYPPNSLNAYTEEGRVQFKFFDITVENNAGQPIPGRVWSEAWQFNCGPVESPPTGNRFYGTMFILSDDSVVTSVNCNGFIGGTFSISSNKTGCSSTGNIETDRQSRTGFHTHPQYKVFLTDPDSIVFPTGKAQPGIILPVTVTNHCPTGSVDLGIKVTQDGFIEVLIEVDAAPGAGPRDVKITANVLEDPGGNGYNIIHWNGNDGSGQKVANGTPVTATIRFIRGITHLPIYDIEYNDNGYKVDVVRPAGPKPDIYWDDSLLGIQGTVNLTGCSNPAGCHTWDNATGDTNTTNSWWYVAGSSIPAVHFAVYRSPGSLGTISGEPSFCSGGISRKYAVKRERNSTSYAWSYSGTGASVTGNDTVVTVSFSDSATSGVLSVSGYNPDCGYGPASNLQINFSPPPQVSLAGFDSICLNSPAIAFSGGSPPGGIYQEDGTPQPEFNPATAGPGNHTIIYIYTDTHGCSNSDTSQIFVKNGKECEILLIVPNAFTPDGDGLNDIFRPVFANIWKFSMEIFNRYGEMVFSSANPDNGWNGTFKGKPCPDGNYVYIIVYQSSGSPPQSTTVTGNVILLR